MPVSSDGSPKEFRGLADLDQNILGCIFGREIRKSSSMSLFNCRKYLHPLSMHFQINGHVHFFSYKRVQNHQQACPTGETLYHPTIYLTGQLSYLSSCAY